MKKMCIDFSAGFAGCDEDINIQTRCETSEDLEVVANQIQQYLQLKVRQFRQKEGHHDG